MEDPIVKMKNERSDILCKYGKAPGNCRPDVLAVSIWRANQAPSLPQVASQDWDRHVRAELRCSTPWQNLANVNRRECATV